MRRRRSHQADSLLKLNIGDGETSGETPTFQMDRLRNYAQPPVAAYEPVTPEPTPAAEREPTPIEIMFQQIHERVGATTVSAQIKKVDRELADLKRQFRTVTDELERAKGAVQTGALELIWKQKQFFTEVIDMAEKAGDVDVACIKPEYRSLNSSLERIRALRTLDPVLYYESGICDGVLELFEFYAGLQTSGFSFKGKEALINLEWIQAGWFWTEEDGGEDFVPKVFEKSVMPLLLNRLKMEKLETEDDFRMAFVHCLEASDYCVHGDMAAEELLRCLNEKLNLALSSRLLTKDSYEQILDEFGFQKPGWVGL